MEWFILGALVVAMGWGLASWARRRNIAIRWYVWVLGVLAALLATVTAMDYGTLMTARQPGEAGGILWLLGTPALVLALIVVACVWREYRKTIGMPTKD